MIDKSTLSHYAAARRDALPDIDDAALAGPLEAFFAAGLEDGVASFAAKVEGLPAHLGRLPEPWREAAYAWLWIWVEPSVPAAEARQVLDAGAGPTSLAEAHAGRYRYGVSGSLVAYVDATWSRAAVVDLLAVRSPDEVLARLGVDEATLLEGWRAWVTR